MIFSDENIERLFRLIFTGKVNEYELDEPTYYAIADYLKKSLYSGFGITFTELADKVREGSTKWTNKDLELLTELRENVYMFSAAKTFQETIAFKGALVDEDGNIRTFKEFKEAAIPVNEQWNNNWLKTEYDTAYGQAQSAVKWNQIEKQKDVLPYLKYSAILDERTSDICAPLDGLTLPVDDPIWDSVSPLNHFNCRCVLEQVDEEVEVTRQDDADEVVNGVKDKMEGMFMMNPGKDRVVFKDSGSDKHPYFDVESKYKSLAKNNFGLPIPEEDE